MGKNYSSLSSLPSTVASQCLRHSKYIKIYYKTISNSSLFVNGMSFASQLFQNNQKLKNGTNSKRNLVSLLKSSMLSPVHETKSFKL